jgi:hypothetical protein
MGSYLSHLQEVNLDIKRNCKWEMPDSESNLSINKMAGWYRINKKAALV